MMTKKIAMMKKSANSENKGEKVMAKTKVREYNDSDYEVVNEFDYAETDGRLRHIIVKMPKSPILGLTAMEYDLLKSISEGNENVFNYLVDAYLRNKDKKEGESNESN